MLEAAAKSFSIVLNAVEWKSILPALAALSGVWLQSRLSRRQAFSAKLWELRREAYADFLARIYHQAVQAGHLADVLDNLHADGQAVPEQRLKQLEAMLALDKEFSDITTRGSLVWSRGFSRVALKWRDELTEAQKDPDDRRKLHAFADVTMKHYEALHSAARSELRGR